MVNAVKRAPLRRAGRGEWKCGCGVINETKAGPRCHACQQLKHPGLQPARGTVPGKPSKTGPLETPVKQAANGADGPAPQAKTWKCASCQGQTPEPLPVCNVCQLPTNPRLEAKAAANGKKPKKSAEASAELTPPNGIESDVPIGSIVVGDKNPRIHFDEAKLQEAAESLKTHGQLQNLVVWQPDRLKSKGQYELIAGERRLRAGKIASLPAMRCRILQGITEEQATELRGIENLIREDLSAIETARWYQQMLDLTHADGSKRYTQASLAERLKCSQPTIANRLRLLRLPDEWQQRVIRREISESHALELVAWSDLPQVLAASAKDLEDEGEAPSLKAWRDWIRQNANQASRPMTPGQNYNFNTSRGYEWGTVLFTAEDVERLTEQLDVRTVDGFNGPEKRAFNVTEWTKLHGKLRAKQHREQQKKANEPAAKDADTPQAKAAQLKADRARQAKNLKSDLETYWVQWHESKVADAARSQVDGDELLKLLLAVCIADDWMWQEPFEAALNKMKVPKAKKSLKGRTDRAEALLERLAYVKNLESLLREAIASKMQGMNEVDGFEAIAQFAGVELAKTWTVDREFLEMHAVWQLKELAAGWKLSIEFDDPVKETPAAKKKAIERILAASKAKRLPVPKSLLEAKP